MSLELALARGIEARVTPGAAVVVIGRDRVIAAVDSGHTAAAVDGGGPVDERTIYDLASLTKPLATWALTARAIAAGELSLETSAREVLGDLPARWQGVTVRHLLGHGAGLPAHRDYYVELWTLELADARRRLFELVFAESPVDAPGRSVVYSDLGYITLAAMLEAIDGRRLDQQFAAEIAAPLAMTSTSYRPIGEVAPADPAAVAPTERDEHRGLVVGEVHDENAHAAGGVCGHAGLFGTAGDVARFAIEILAAARGERRELFDPAVVVELVESAAAPETTWRLGWDTPSPPPVRSHAGDRWPRTGFGHLGFTGTSLWLDPPAGAAVVLLSNRVYYGRDPDPIRDLRREIMDTAHRELEHL